MIGTGCRLSSTMPACMAAWFFHGGDMSTAQTVGCLIEVFWVISKFPVLNLELEHINIDCNTLQFSRCVCCLLW